MNPYAAPQVDVMPLPSAASQAEVIRRQHINTEATIKSIGTLHYLGAFILVGVGLSSLITMRPGQEAAAAGIGLFLVALGVGQGFLAYGLRRLLPAARVPAIVLACLGLLGFPVGTIISIYFLVTLAGAKGKTVMTPEYGEIIKATPHIKRKTSIAVWIILALALIAVIGLLAAAMLNQ